MAAQVEGVSTGLSHDRRSGMVFVAPMGQVLRVGGNWKSPGPPRSSPRCAQLPRSKRGRCTSPQDKARKLDARRPRRSGRLPWARCPQALEIGDPNSRWDHYGSSPVLSGGLAYVGSRDGCLYAFEARSGKQERRICTGDQITATPVVADGQVFFASFDGHVYSARLTDGAVLWKRDAKGAVPRDLALAHGRIVAGSRSYDLLALDPGSGRPAWTR